MTNSLTADISVLVSHLVQAYDGTAMDDDRLPASRWSLQVDDRTFFDRSWDFCSLTLLFSESGQLQLRIHSLPMDDDVRQCLVRMRARFEDLPDGPAIFVPIEVRSVRRLKQLATLVRRVVGRGRRYSNRNWKWVAPRAAKSLNRFADVLAEYPGPIHSPSLSTAIRREHGSEVSE